MNYTNVFNDLANYPYGNLEMNNVLVLTDSVTNAIASAEDVTDLT